MNIKRIKFLAERAERRAAEETARAEMYREFIAAWEINELVKESLDRLDAAIRSLSIQK